MTGIIPANMKRLVPTFIAIALLLNACAPDAQLWGAYLTPTPADPSGGAVISEATPTQALAADAPQIILTDLAALSNPILLATTVAPQTTETPAPAIITETATLAARTVTPNTQTGQPILYYAQSGDTLAGLAVRFGVERAEITSPKILPEGSLIDPGTLLIIPNRITEETTSNVQVMPDSEVVFSATASDFNIPQFIANAGGHLSIYREYLGSTGWTTGAQAFTRLTYENSANPRLVLALLEYESHWVYSASSSANEEYPLGFVSLKYKGLFLQMVWAVNQLYAGYYGWRTGALTELTFPNGETLRLHPELNAGTVAVLYFFSRLHNRSEWEQIVNPESVNSFTGLYNQMFGDPWARSQLVEPLLPMGISQPKLLLPFEPNREWHLISGPHGAWEKDGPLAAIDLAPSTDHGGCSRRPPGCSPPRRVWSSVRAAASWWWTSTATASNKPAGTCCTCTSPPRDASPWGCG